MPWTVLPDPDLQRRRVREANERVRGLCVETLVADSGAALRRNISEEMAAIAALLTDARYCAPCLMVTSNLDARAVYRTIELLKGCTNIDLVRSRCDRCRRETTVWTIGP